MSKIKQIKHPDFVSATRLTPLQLNSTKIDGKHTVLTPELLEEMAKEKNKSS